jgi:flagellar assembly factor FliW
MTYERNTFTFDSSRFGQFEVSYDSIITLPKGMIGFPKFTKFVMIDYKEPFSWLHSIEEPSLAFVVIDGSILDHEFDVESALTDPVLNFKEGEEYAMLLVVTVRSEPPETTVNVKAPIIVNVNNKQGVQVIFDNPKYSVRQHLY